MKIKINTYTFIPASRQIVFADASFALKNLLAVVNVTDGLIIYNPSDPSTIGTTAGVVLTLLYDTTLMSATDDLLIYYDDGVRDDAAVTSLDDTVQLLKKIAKSAESLAVIDGNQRQKIAIETINNLTGIGGIVGTVRIEQTGGFGALFLVDQRYEFMDRARMSYATSVRPNLIFS